MSELVLPKTQSREIRRKAMDLLARREHSLAELRRKLMDKGYEKTDVEEQLQQLERENLLSDRRFAESYVNHRSKKGFGPVRIKQELNERGISEALAEEFLSDKGVWLRLAREVREKRFGSALPREYKDKARQLRFLQYRGFSHDQLRALFEAE